MGSLLGDLSGWVADVIESLGYWGLALLVALESMFPPIPSEIVLPLAGFLTGQGRMNYFLAVGAATVGSVTGALVLYGAGYAFGEHRIRAIIRSRGRWLGFKEEDVDKADEWFDKYGGIAVMTGRVIPVVRSLISIPAGLRRMALPRFVLYTMLGSLTWNSLLIGAGWILGDNWEHVEHYVGYLQYVVIAAVLIVGILWAWFRILKPWMESRQGGTS
jgi:membrane protein DedA with SNARE-associated domain